MKKYRWGGLFNKKRFVWMEDEREKRLQNLTMTESIKMTEDILSSNMFEKFRKNIIYDRPVSFKIGLKTRKENVRSRI